MQRLASGARLWADCRIARCRGRRVLAANSIARVESGVSETNQETLSNVVRLFCVASSLSFISAVGVKRPNHRIKFIRFAHPTAQELRTCASAYAKRSA